MCQSPASSTSACTNARWGYSIAAWLAAVAVGLTCVAAGAAQELYDYDALGRLIRMVDGQGRVTEYIYDAVGNILEVRTGVAAAAPTVADISPSAVQRGTTAAVTINGTNLTGVAVQVADPQLQVSIVAATSTRVTFNLTVGLAATLGPATIVLRNSLGQVATTIDIRLILPSVSIYSANVGVELAANSAPSVTTYSNLTSVAVGVNYGSVVNSIGPAAGATGQDITLVLTGYELAGVSSLAFSPATGITVGTPVAAGDGSTVQVPLSIAADAPLGARRIQVLAGTTPVRFASPFGDQFQVTLPP